MAIQFWLSFNNGQERIQLPVNPAEINIDSPFGFEDIEVSQLGEITIFKERGLREIQLSSFFPKFYNPNYCEYSNIPIPQEAVGMIERWRDAKRPIRLTITGTNINMACTIRDFNVVQERAGSPGDIYFDITLKEYRFFQVKKIELNSFGRPVTEEDKNRRKYLEKRLTYARETRNYQLEKWCLAELAKIGFPQKSRLSPTTQRPGIRPLSSNQSHTIKKGDTLWLIAKKHYGDGSKWRKVYDANKAKIGKNPNKLKVGVALVIPHG